MSNSLSERLSVWLPNITTYLLLCTISWWAALLSFLLFPSLTEVNAWLAAAGLVVPPLYLVGGFAVHLLARIVVALRELFGRRANGFEQAFQNR